MQLMSAVVQITKVSNHRQIRFPKGQGERVVSVDKNQFIAPIQGVYK